MRQRARRQGGPEGERLEAQATTRLRGIEERIDDLRASLEQRTNESFGSVRVRAWSGLHPKTRKAKERYGSDSACVVKGTVVLVEVGRLPQGERRRKLKALWLWWNGAGAPGQTWLVLAAYAQLRPAKGLVADRRLPWEMPLPTEKLTPYRVLGSFATLLPLVGTLAAAPKPRGRSPGRRRGSRSGRAKRYPAVKQAA